NGDVLLHAAHGAGLDWRSVCGGHGQCRTCFFEVLSGAFDSPSLIEEQALRTLSGTTNAKGPLRLACQARLRSDAMVRKFGVRRAS
ncbi:MAG: (2Fe-2S)-binding protein, partial [Phenylobacterium sp.]|nr:(2Fe-2S)-binding protein [Phenylobacterium sp.]